MAVSYFSIYKLIGWDTANIYLMGHSKHLLVQIQLQDTRNSELHPKLTVKRVESRSGVFINFE